MFNFAQIDKNIGRPIASAAAAAPPNMTGAGLPGIR
jgi:hypothetical protein